MREMRDPKEALIPPRGKQVPGTEINGLCSKVNFI
jgi:hypothetical protein